MGIAHDSAHSSLAVELTSFQSLFVQLVYLAAPLVAAILVWTPLGRAGALLLALSMAGSFFFGAYYHFLHVSPDHVAHLPVGDRRTLFQATAALMLVVDALGTWAGVVLARGPRRARAPGGPRPS